MPDPAASVVVPVHNRLQELMVLLDQLNGQTLPSFEVVVVDDGSDVPVQGEIKKQYAFELRIICQPKRGGIARARNAGIRAARSDLLIFLDSDCDLRDPDWARRHVEAHATTKEIRAVHSGVTGIHSTYAGRADGYSNWFFSCQRHPYRARYHHLPANNTSVPKSVFSVVGFYDEDCEAAEDVEWCFRCLQKDVPLWYIPGMPVGHYDRDSWSALWRHYRKIGQYALVVRQKLPQSPFHHLFPSNRLTGWLYFIPLTCLMTVYITWKWIPNDPRVIFYVPGLLWANIAYYSGMFGRLAHGKSQP